MRKRTKSGWMRSWILLAMAVCGTTMVAAQDDSAVPDGCASEHQGSVFVPVDSWIYPAMARLQGLGYVDTIYLGMRPWTRDAIATMLDETQQVIDDARIMQASDADTADEILHTVAREIGYHTAKGCLLDVNRSGRLESVYSVARGLSGTPLRDSFHLGSTIVNDFGRPYENGINNYTGLSGSATAGRFTLYARGEFAGAPSGTGYSTALAQTLSGYDMILFLNPSGVAYSQPTIPLGPIGSTTKGRLLEAYLAANLFGHTVSFGKVDEWLGPGQGGAMAFSNNAEAVWALHINRTEPLEVPGLSKLTGPFRYEFLVGPLHGHTYVPATKTATGTTWVLPGAPWVHMEKISLRPTRNLEIGFERTAIWGGKGHEPITLHTFLRSFFSVTAPNANKKNSSADPGARFGTFDFSYRLPFLRNWATLYADSEVHDDVSPIDAPRRAAIRPGFYLSHLPGLPKLDLRVEAVSTDPSISNSNGGHFMYWESILRQGYTNNGQIFGDWIGREAKGGQGWLTWHLTPQEWIQASFRNQKVAKDFIKGGTTLNDASVQVVKRIRKDLEINGQFTLEHWKAPIYPTGTPVYPAPGHTVTATTIQITWFPERKVSF